jgi:uncharacterized membrane protein HdeD (DUF308 family)
MSGDEQNRSWPAVDGDVMFETLDEALDDMTPADLAAAEEAAEWSARHWGWFLAGGVVALIFGVIVVLNVFAGLAALAILVAVFFFWAGAYDLATSSRREPAWLGILSGSLALICGLIAVAWPGISLGALAILAGLSFMVWGVTRAASSLKSRERGWGWVFSAGLLSVIVGVWCVLWPEATVVVLAYLLGINAIIFGALEIVGAFQMRKTPSRGRRLRTRRL